MQLVGNVRPALRIAITQKGALYGVSLLMDDLLLLVSALAQDRDSAQMLVIDLASGQQGLVTKVIEANTDAPHSKSRSGGGVYAIKP